MENNAAGADSAFLFTGTWREFAPIAISNLLLTIVTLGIYRFWAKTRERQYLWSHTRFIGDNLEWTGTGKELLVGFLLALLLFAGPLLAINFGLQALVFRGYALIAAISTPLLYVAFLYVMGFARLRALRYRLSRTYWHGIRGGSDDRGFGYAWSYAWKTIVGSFFFGLLLPWAMCELWNERWNAMSFGPDPFTSGAHHGPVLKRLLICYAVGFVGFLGMLFVIGSVIGRLPPADAGNGLMRIFAQMLPLVVILVVAAPLALAYYAVFLREAISNLTLNQLEFCFAARTWDWIKLVVGDLGLLIVTLGLGYVFIGYRHWAFFVGHLEAGGEVSLSGLVQSQTAAPTQGEGLLDALDVGAF